MSKSLFFLLIIYYFSHNNHFWITQWRPLGHFLAQKKAYTLWEVLYLELLISGMYVCKPSIICFI